MTPIYNYNQSHLQKCPLNEIAQSNRNLSYLNRMISEHGDFAEDFSKFANFAIQPLSVRSS
ncbi:1459_t:CDS:2 [Entrophospora sp. SA101]|nr:1459_t:CDS:2 [Entrophospora sp. SA101]